MMYVIDAVLDSFFKEVYSSRRDSQKVNSQTCYFWAAIVINTNDMLVVYASK
jgi:hypothetical protein